jgi:hypothetical protein
MMSASPPPDMELSVPAFLRRAAPEDVSLTGNDGAATPPGRWAHILRRLRSSGLPGLHGRVDWSSDPEALRWGEWDGKLSPDLVARLRETAKRPEVRQLAAALGLTAELVALALLAHAEAALDRAAARFARAILGKAEPANVEKAIPQQWPDLFDEQRGRARAPQRGSRQKGMVVRG